MLTLLSPCTLPVIPLVFASVSGRKGQLILLLFGMGLMFTAVSLLATAAGGWLVNLTIVGRWLALGFFWSLWLSVCCQHALQAGSDRQRLRWVINLTNRAIVMAVGSLQYSPDWRLDYFWAPCAGPVLGAIFSPGVVARKFSDYRHLAAFLCQRMRADVAAIGVVRRAADFPFARWSGR